MINRQDPIPHSIFNGYHFDPANLYWIPDSDRPDFAYSDGLEVEQRLLQIIRSATDLGSTSLELRSHISDWPSKYHLSPTRANLLRPFEGLLRGQVLEIGSGCGAITRFLGECGGKVVALEGSGIRAATTAARCRDLKNVEVLVDTFHRLVPKPQFDVVTLIGVLEYARKYFPSENDDPVDALLLHAKKFLKPSGILIVAIENQLGLKYFAGFGEDHVGTPMFGIEDQYQKNGVVTFGRKELQARLENTGLKAQRWWYPFPDYKLPTVLFSHFAFNNSHNINYSPLIGPALASDPQMPSDPLFLMERTWPVIHKNDLAPDMANSFLVLSATTEKAYEDSTVLAHHFAVERKREYAKQVVFKVAPDGNVFVTAEKLYPKALPLASIPLQMHLDEKPFLAGRHWGDALKNILTTPGWSIGDLINWASIWFDALLKNANVRQQKGQLSSQQLLSGDLLDAIPRNLFVKEDDSTEFIDQEWRLQFPIELGFLIFRGIYLSLLSIGKIAMPAPGTSIKATALLGEIAQSLGVWIVEADIVRYCDFENDIQNWASGFKGLSIDSILAFHLDVRKPFPADQLKALAQTLVERSKVIEALTGSLDDAGRQISALSYSKADLENQVSELNAKIHEVSDWAMQLQHSIVERDKQITDTHQAITQRDSLIMELNSKIQEVSDWATQLKKSIDDRDEQIITTHHTIAQQEKLIVELNTKVLEVSDWTSQLQQSIAGRDDEIAISNRHLTERESIVIELGKKIFEANEQEVYLKQMINQRDDQIAEMKRSIADRDSRIAEFNTKIHEVSNRAIQLQQSVAERDRQITSTYDALAQRDNAIVELNAKIHEVSDWASRIDSNPFTYGYKKYAFNLARRIYRMLPMEIKTKQKLRDTFLSTSKKLYRKLNVPLKLRLAKPSRQVAEILAVAPPAKDRDIFVFSVIDWHFRIQRPQHLARSFASTGRRVFFFSNHFVDDSEPGYQIEQLDSSMPLYQIKLHVKGAPAIYFEPPTPEAEAMLKASITRLIIDFGATSTVSLIQHAYWFSLAKQLPNTYRTYDCMDHHDGFGNVPEKLNAIEKNMLREADLVVVTSTWLENFAHSYNSNVSIIRNAGEFDHFSTLPNTVYVDSLGRKIIGYYGAIADWFDLDLIRKVAINFPDCLVLLVGSDTVNAGNALSDLQNVMLTGEIPYKDLPFYLHAFDVCLLPFKVIPLTLATNPVKVYEYLSAGKAVVCVNLPEISQFGEVVWRADTPAEFIGQIAQALSSDENSLEHINARLAFACNQTWGHRIAELNTAFDKLSWPKISVIVLTYNNLDLTKACLESLIEETDYPNLEIIVVDNASADDTPDYLRQFTARHPDVKIKLNKKNLGFAAGNNVGLAAATGDYLVLLNNDTVVTRGWALTLLRHLQADPSIGLIGPTTNNIGNEARIAMKYDDIAHMPREALNLTLNNMGKLLPMRNAAFFCAMLPRSTYETCGPICEDYGRGFFEDDDYCRRVEAVGLRIVCADDVFIHHHLSASFNKLKDHEKQELFARNKIIYEKKWGPWIPHSYRN